MIEDDSLPDRIGFQQRVIPVYRGPLFDHLAECLPRTRLQVFSGRPRRGEAVTEARALGECPWVRGRNRYLGGERQFLLWQSGLERWLTAYSPQMLVLEANPRYLSNMLALWRMRGSGRPVIGWTLGPAKRARGGSGWAPLLLDYYRSFDALVTYSKAGARTFASLGIAEERIFVAPNAVQPGDARRVSRMLDEDPTLLFRWREELGLGAGPVVLFVGRLQPRKRVDLLLRACARQSRDVQMLVVGDGPDRVRLESLAEVILPRTRFVGERFGLDLGICFAVADLFVMPGTGGLALQEALTYGKPVAVAEADGSQADLVQPGINGWLLLPGDEDHLAIILEEALANPARLRTMGQMSSTIVEREATLERMGDGFLSAFNEVWSWKSRHRRTPGAQAETREA
jgi:glycosyltransferase involved in cell wall biosynthesis